jgi:hypothetical protein
MLVIVRNANHIYGLQLLKVIFIGNLNYQKIERLEESGFANKMDLHKMLSL